MLFLVCVDQLNHIEVSADARAGQSHWCLVFGTFGPRWLQRDGKASSAGFPVLAVVLPAILSRHCAADSKSRWLHWHPDESAEYVSANSHQTDVTADRK